ncbi:MAG: HDOD domain-containing protein [Saccharospirillum sp.]|nr:HDOD domain-containing protein [Saccharospirillum sp.]
MTKMTHEDWLQRIAEAIDANQLILPSLPEVAIQVRTLTGKDDCDVSLLERTIAKDAAITARLIKVAGNASRLRGKPLTSLRLAITSLGLNLVRSLVTQLAILQTMNRSGDPARLKGFVASSLSISALCHTIAEHHPHLDPEQASLAGLLHDIGKLPLRDFCRKQSGISPTLAQSLEQALHPQVGALMLEHWQMDSSLIDVAREHEDMQRTGNTKPDYTDLVITANLIHYGVDKGRYAHLKGMRIPALEKSLPDHLKASLKGSSEQRMAMALQLIQ